MSGPAPEAFAALFAQTGLNPAEHDLEALGAAVARLGVLMERLDPGDPEAPPPLFLFDPAREF